MNVQKNAGSPPPTLSARARFRAAAACQPVDRPPVWFMRQAGRALPEYRALKEKYTFLELVQNPELATEVTLQPVRRFGFDAAILFSDILVVCEALGQPYRFRETGGIEMAFAIRSAADLARLNPSAVVERLQYVNAALQLLRKELGDRTALLGFSGSPWTLANFMLEGGSASPCTRALALWREEPALFGRLMETLATAIVDYLRMQLRTGVDAVQIFDTLAGLLPPTEFMGASGRWLGEIVSALGSEVPVTVFAKGIPLWQDLAATGARILGVDSSVAIADVRAALPPTVAVQGNLEPTLLLGEPGPAVAATRAILDSMRGQRGHVFNLGHGVPPNARLDTIGAVVEAVVHS